MISYQELLNNESKERCFMNTGSDRNIMQIGNHESVININTNDKGKFWSSCLFSLSYTFTTIIVLFLS